MTPFERYVISHPKFKDHVHSFVNKMISVERAAEWLTAIDNDATLCEDVRNKGYDSFKGKTKYESKYVTVIFDIGAQNYAASVGNMKSKDKKAVLEIYFDCPDFDKLFKVVLKPSQWNTRLCGLTKNYLKFNFGKMLGYNKKKVNDAWFAQFCEEIK